MARDPIPTWCFSLVVVRSGARFLLVHEQKHGQRWYLPAGRVEPGESFTAAAARETLEEAGIPIVLEGILRIEHTPLPGGTARLRIIFLARPADDRPPKSEADEESLEAAWFTLADLDRIPLRGEEVRELLHAVAAGSLPIGPITLLGVEGGGEA
jgi:phosphatase NudJ